MLTKIFITEELDKNINAFSFGFINSMIAVHVANLDSYVIEQADFL